ncbi:hypothetical protein Tco_1234121, partial [Tanacetum coccineum]
DSKVEVVFDDTANLRISTSGKDRDIPTGYWNDRLANLTLILVGLRVLRDNFAYKEYGIRLMLAPRSARALHEKDFSEESIERAGGKNQPMKAVKSSSHVSIVEFSKFPSQVFMLHTSFDLQSSKYYGVYEGRIGMK